MSAKRLLSDVYWGLWRELRVFFQQIVRLVGIVAQPVIWFMLIGSSIEALATRSYAVESLSTASYIDYMLPGVIALYTLQRGAFAGASIMWDKEKGFLNRMLSAPIYRAAIPLGKVLGLIVQNWIEVVTIIIIAVLCGVKIAAGIPGILFILLITGLLGLIVGCLSLSVAVAIKTPEVLYNSIGIVVMIFTFTSNALFPIQGRAEWLYYVGIINPLTYAVNPIRIIVTEGWVWDSILTGLATLVLAAAVSVWFAIHQFRKSIE